MTGRFENSPVVAVAFTNVPLSARTGREQLVSIVSAHPTFAFRQLLDLILASATLLDSLETGKSRAQENRPDLISPKDTELVIWGRVAF